jgi:hypothetical protein
VIIVKIPAAKTRFMFRIVLSCLVIGMSVFGFGAQRPGFAENSARFSPLCPLLRPGYVAELAH